MSSGRPRNRSPVALVALLLVVDLLGGAAALGSERLTIVTDAVAAPAPSPSPSSTLALPTEGSADEARRTAVTALLAARSAAILARDRPGWLATVDPSNPELQTSQGEVFDWLAPVPISSWSYELDADRYGPLSAEAGSRYGTVEVWRPDIRLRYSLTGFDAEPASDQQVLTFVVRDGVWYLGGSDESVSEKEVSVRNIWDEGPVQVLTGSRTLVMGHPGQEPGLRRLLDDMEAAGPRVDAAWGTDWARTVVVQMPSTTQEFGRLVGEGPFDEIAAVAKAELIGPPDDRTGVGERVLVNPPNYARLNKLGRRVVLTHELAHVASRSISDESVPIWLVEGVADYIGYLATDVTDDSAARELADDVRAGNLPADLPDQVDFAGNNAALAQAYESSWMACRLIAELGGGGEDGTRALVDFYRAVAASPEQSADEAVDAALLERLGLTRVEFVNRWQQYLRDALG